MPDPTPPLTLTVAQAARAIGVDERAARRLVANNILPTVRLGRTIRIRVRDLAEVLGLPAAEVARAAAEISTAREDAAVAA
ncbi:helix-turn-helix domain-containing protein [Microbacterium sp.]|uniref:helix-turn-helix domain-containing protein n=1 Tax=Microbacterium sp. TaxID=51671 RepID=UPI00263697FE|nr:helix-turn-helix domain-containing protein [Microbacterium sp.]